MKDMGIVIGGKLQAQPLVINNTNVYIHTDIKELPDGMYEYHEYQISLDEFLSKVLPEVCSSLNLNLVDILLSQRKEDKA